MICSRYCSAKLYIGETAILTYSTLLGVEDAPPTLHYTLHDRLGSVVSVVDDSNTVIEHRSYDPFGKPRQGSLVSSSPATLSDLIGGTPVTQRGFTDHEHLDDAQLIHMNGRVYDYNLGRFLSVDPFIQAPGNSQSLNPYSYIMNNPLAGTDPSGYLSCSAEQTVGECGLEAGGTADIVDSDGNSLGTATLSEDGETLTTSGNNGVNATITGKVSNGVVLTLELQNKPDIGSQSHAAKGSAELPLGEGGTNVGNNPSADSTNREAVEFNGTETACVGGGAACTPSSQWVNISLGYTDTPVGMGTNHALVIVTDPLTGEQYATRAGPSLFKTDEGGSGVGLGTIRAESGVYDKTFRDSPDKVHTTQHVGKINITFAEAVSRMHEFAQVTNSNLIPYKPSFNSNSYAFTFVESLGFKRPTPKVWSPGWESGRADTKELSYLK